MNISKTQKILTYTILIIFAIIIAFPIIFSILLSFSDNADILNGIYIPGKLKWENYLNAFRAQPLLLYLKNTLIVAMSATVLEIILALFAAYALVFIPFKGKNIIFGLFMATMMIPSEVLIISNFKTIRSCGLLDTYMGLILPGLASTFGIFLLRQNLKQIPWELKEASQVAGVGDFKFFYKVVIPMVKNTIVTLAINNFLGNWNAYMWPLLSTTDDTVRTVQIGLRQLSTSEGVNDYGMMTAGAIIVSLPTLLLIFFGQGRLQEGLSKGALK